MTFIRAALFALSVLTLLPAVFGGAADAQSETPFVPGFEDLPLAPGLTAESEAPVAFITPAGRIIESSASGRLTPDAVFGFYARTLPQLGWNGTESTPKSASYQREDEQLILSVLPDGPAVNVTFRLTPSDPTP